MYTYEIAQWLIFFYIYSFVGWIWESCYVSVKKRRWVNRGFLNGPFLPIYGFGALTILLSTIAVRESVSMIFLVGMTAATVLEYATGAVMEQLFHVRYWDYSNQKLNLNGHICVSSSLAWGVFSILLVRIVHPPVESLVHEIPLTAVQAAVLIFSIWTACDFTQSFREAVDLKETLAKLTNSSERIRKLQKRLEVAAAFADQETESISHTVRGRLARKGEFLRNVEEYRQNQSHRLKELAQKLTQSVEAGKQRKEEIEALQEQLMRELQELGARTDQNFRHAARQLRRNPGMRSERYEEALREIHRIMRRKK